MTPHSLFSLANLYFILLGFYALLSFLFQCNEFISCIDNLFFQVKVLNLFFCQDGKLIILYFFITFNSLHRLKNDSL